MQTRITKFIGPMIAFSLLPFQAAATTLSDPDPISEHYQALPVQYDFDKVPIEQISEKVKRQYVMGAQSTLVKWTLQKGALIAKHHHSNEQITWITQGSVEVSSQGKKFTLKAGGLLVIPSNVPHELRALEDTIDIEIFTPARQDWIDQKN